MTATRRLAAILADVAGYSRMIGADEGGTLDRLRSIRADMTDPKIAEHRGRIGSNQRDTRLTLDDATIRRAQCGNQYDRKSAGIGFARKPGVGALFVNTPTAAASSIQ